MVLYTTISYYLKEFDKVFQRQRFVRLIVLRLFININLEKL